MTKITIDDVLREKLLNLDQSLEICDESGRVLARVEPICDPARLGSFEPEISDEELDRRAKSDGPTYSTEEVLERLKNR